jgi:ABC-type antimicrobial peptide transport system permease subunit
MLLLGLFGALALVIAALGIYGVMGYAVSQRTFEIGIRMALGAMPASILMAFLGRALAVLIAGVCLGLACAWSVAGFAKSFLFEVQPHDPIVYVAASLVLVAAGVGAALIPAGRAARVDPLIALRAE